jgi:LacI family transcriptional regulator
MSGKKSTGVTLRDVAAASGHSLSTVDRVLSGRAAVRAETAQRIREAAQMLGYRGASVIEQRVRSARPRRRFGFLLQQPSVPFYQGLEAELERATAACDAIHGRALVQYLASQSPEKVAEALRHLGTRVDALAVVVADHPLVSEAVADLARRGVPVFALISDLSAPERAGYAGLDNRRLGRTAAWFVSSLARRAGPVALVVGSHRFQCQETAEISFRSHLREHAPKVEILETLLTLESEDYAEERMHELLRAHRDLAAFYVGGNGIGGVLRALQAHPPRNRAIGVANDLTAVTRAALTAGWLHAVLSHPLAMLAEALVAQMAEALARPGAGLRQIIVPLEIHVPPSV